MNTRNIIAVLLILASLACLFPGLFYPMMSVNVSATIPIMGKMMLHENTQSILNTIETLYENNNVLVAGLILLFSVIVPIIKAVLLMIVLFFKNNKHRASIYNFVSFIGKWSMADVFVVGVLLAYLGTSSEGNIEAILHSGFYFFLAYCIISMIAIQVMDIDDLLDRSSPKA